jgi:hypothetical protein
MLNTLVLMASEIGGPKMRRKCKSTATDSSDIDLTAHSTVMGFGTSVDVVSAFIVTFCLPYLLKTPGANLGAKVGYIMGGDAILSLIFAIFFVPEIAVSRLRTITVTCTATHLSI